MTLAGDGGQRGGGVLFGRQSHDIHVEHVQK